MARYCFYCGKELAKNEKCQCNQTKYSEKFTAGTSEQAKSANPNPSGSTHRSPFKNIQEYIKNINFRGAFSFNRYSFITKLRQLCNQISCLISRPYESGSIVHTTGNILPGLLMAFNTLFLYVMINRFLNTTGLGNLLTNNVFNYNYTHINLPLVMAIAYVFHWLLKILFTFLLMRIYKFHRATVNQCYKATFPAIIYQTCFIIFISCFIYGSGILSLLLFVMAFSFCILSDSSALAYSFNLNNNQSLIMTIISYLGIIFILSGLADIVFQNIIGIATITGSSI